ncbi:hypothetical protein VTI74DRAFT_11241 [Chaetomium olivicolor]
MPPPKFRPIPHSLWDGNPPLKDNTASDNLRQLNDTSQRDSEVHLASTAEILRLVETCYTEIYFSSATCPPKLSTCINLISDLRTDPAAPETTDAATDMLALTEAFSPEHVRLLHSKIYHSATALYAILSLQSPYAIPTSPELELSRARHARVLFFLLETGMATPRVKERMTWPQVVVWCRGREGERGDEEVCGGEARWDGERSGIGTAACGEGEGEGGVA